MTRPRRSHLFMPCPILARWKARIWPPTALSSSGRSRSPPTSKGLSDGLAARSRTGFGKREIRVRTNGLDLVPWWAGGGVVGRPDDVAMAAKASPTKIGIRFPNFNLI